MSHERFDDLNSNDEYIDIDKLMMEITKYRINLGKNINEIIFNDLKADIDKIKNHIESLASHTTNLSISRRMAAISFIHRFMPPSSSLVDILKMVAMEDPSPSIRANAVMGIGVMGKIDHVIKKDHDVFNFICAILLDETEKPLVRETAYLQLVDDSIVAEYAPKLKEFDINIHTDENQMFIIRLKYGV